MTLYIFACNQESYPDCMRLRLFGVKKSYVSGIKVGDPCLLYDYSSRRIHGLWEAASPCGNHEPTAWNGAFPFQVRVSLLGDGMRSLALGDIFEFRELHGDDRWKLHGETAQAVLSRFTRESPPVTPVIREEVIENFRDRYSCQFRCDDGHMVRSLSEQAIDNWLSRNGYQHAYEPELPMHEQMIPDFSVSGQGGQTVYIEFWGRPDDPAYSGRIQRKRAAYRSNRLTLIELYPHHLNDLNHALRRLLRQHGL